MHAQMIDEAIAGMWHPGTSVKISPHPRLEKGRVVGAIRYDARCCERSSPGPMAFEACETLEPTNAWAAVFSPSANTRYLFLQLSGMGRAPVSAGGRSSVHSIVKRVPRVRTKRANCSPSISRLYRLGVLKVDEYFDLERSEISEFYYSDCVMTATYSNVQAQKSVFLLEDRLNTTVASNQELLLVT